MAQPVEYKSRAKQILDATGVKGGLVVHLGCGQGRLTAALHANDRYLVHGLDPDAENVRSAIDTIKSLGLYGKVSIEQLRDGHLPYVDNLVNLVVSENVGYVPREEIMRVLAPGGVAYIKDNGHWTKTVKPKPDDIDDWTHFLHDASNNAVADDTQVGPPRRLKWICGPLWSRSHEFISSLCAMVSSNGRLFYVFDEGLTGVTTESLPERWTLIARDAFNGKLLWKRPLSEWGSRAWKTRALRNAPQTIPRRLVGQGDRLYIVLEYDAPVAALDAATGETRSMLEGTEQTDEIRCCEGVLLSCKSNERLTAMDTETGKQLWEVKGKIRPLTLAVDDGNVFYQEGSSLVSRRLKDGGKCWQIPSDAPVPLLVVRDGCVLVLSRKMLQALDADSGNVLWTLKGGVGRNELFVAQGQVWHWQDNRIVGSDLTTGHIVTRLDTSDVFTEGHHLRCYQSKATENFLITPNRGVEFVSITGGVNTQNDWVRGPCRYGIIACNGLLYVAPNPCFCYPGAKVTGFNALAPACPKTEDREQKTERLEKGSAYGKISNLKSQISHQKDWLTYRHDPQRTGSTACEVPGDISPRWRVRLHGALTPPVVGGDRLYVAAKNEHTLYAMDARDGEELWHFTAGGRIDSSPTLYDDLVLFGCADGCVYCLRASDGMLAWRFQAAPSNQRIIAFDQLESPWHVHGSILIKDGVAYCTAGRSSYLDGGIRIYGLDPVVGNVRYETCVDTWSRTRTDAKDKPFIPGYHMEGTNSDILVSEGGYIYLGQYKFDRTLVSQPVPYIVPEPETKTHAMDLMDQPFIEGMESQAEYEKEQHDWQWIRVHKAMMQSYQKRYGGASMGDRDIGLHVFSTSGFLDDSWFNRTFWMYSATWPGYYLAHRAAKTGQLLVVGPERTYAVQSYPSRNLQSPLFTPGEKGYLLFADENDNEPVLADYTRGVPKGIGFTRARPPVWFKWVPVRIRAMVLAGGQLFVAGPPDVVDPYDPMGSFDGRKGAMLRAHSTTDGAMLTEHKLDAPPVFDGLIAANGQLYLSLENGTVLCMGKNR
ncbi:MAG: PQQ-binding-like beta-propeller repeat protein [Sedimentisphaerales bacterium]|nr:PQQ-binding-like beta-propeller repeat protein [Sedimentisphaerales bacterium]